MGCCYPVGENQWFQFHLTNASPVRSNLHVHTRQTLYGHSYATGCKASGMLKAGELTLEETSYIMSRSAGKGTRSV